jgi:capsular polysaccharide export protein
MEESSSTDRCYALTSIDLWRQRHGLAAVLKGRLKLWPFCNPRRIDAFIGWGWRTSGRRAAKLSRRFGKPVITMEDGFLRSVNPGLGEPSHSFIIDRTGIHFDRMAPGDLFDIIEKNDFTADELRLAEECMAAIRRARLSKYNNSGAPPAEFRRLIEGRKIVLVVEQVPGDASIPRDMDVPAVWAEMLQAARRENPDALIVVRPHPANRTKRPFAPTDSGVDYVSSPPCNPWFLLERARHVYTIASHLGFEAMMAGKPVTTYGAPFYAGWQASEDRFPGIPKGPKRSTAELFAAAYLRYSHYYDPATRRASDLRAVIEKLTEKRERFLAGQQAAKAGAGEPEGTTGRASGR